MKLNQLLNGLTECRDDLIVKGLKLDSRHVEFGDVFFAIRGAQQHGLAYAEEAIKNGAAAIIYDPIGCDETLLEKFSSVTIAISNLSAHLGILASKFYENPSQQIAVIGVTGTNGKTTCTNLIAQSLKDCGCIGTLGWGDLDNLLPTLNTTPDAFSVQDILKTMVAEKKSAVAIEVSSHALQQGRVNGVKFKGAVFTNLSRDHLDYHDSMEAYFQAKLSLFTRSELEFVVVNIDDPAGGVIIDNLSKNVQCWTYSTKGKTRNSNASLSAENIRHTKDGIHFKLNWQSQTIDAYTPLTGSFNLENSLASLGVMLAMKIDLVDAVNRLALLRPIPGRMQKFGGHQQPTIFVDYAHSPDALEKVLYASKGDGRLWVVFGCGGNRDKGKRPEMGRIAESIADQVLITADNPREEEPEQIMQDILAGCRSSKVRLIPDRMSAIMTAILEADIQDRIVVAGKGHENYQEIKGCKLPFSDAEAIKQSLALRGSL
jgi:UDP-N-acetylmuramoyl-L-alanyl-D-glutamate--2,6-diaminopimelate ligase